MLSGRFAAVVLAFGVLGIPSSGLAQGPPPVAQRGLYPQSQQPKSLAEQFDDFTQRLFGAMAGGQGERSRPGAEPAAQSVAAQPEAASDRQAESILAVQPADGRSTPMSRLEQLTPKSPLGSRPASLPGQSRADTGAQEAAGRMAMAPPFDGRVTTGSNGVAKVVAGGEDPMLLPLYKRLEAFQSSAFADTAGTGPTAEPIPADDAAAAARQAGAGPVGPTADPSRAGAAPLEVPTPAVAGVAVVPLREPTPAVPRAVVGVQERLGPSGAATPLAAEPLQVPTLAPEQPRSREVNPGAPGAKEPGLLFAGEGPALSVETAGPRQITVGREAAYEVTISNRGKIGAEDVVVYVALPPWADIVDCRASSGETDVVGLDRDTQPVAWRIEHLAAQSRETLVLRILPRESRPFDLAVRWEYEPVASQAMIEVQEPKLAIALNGPRDVLYGQKELYTLDFSNTGNGDAENVVLTLVPIGTGENQPVSQGLGRIEAGQRKTVEVELTARQVGDLTIKVQLRGDGGLYAELAERVTVRRAALQVDVEGPKTSYLGAVAGYRVSVRNLGNAAAKGVKVSASLPPKAEYVSGIEGARVDADGTKVRWELASLEPAAVVTFVLKCRLDSPGATQLDVFSTADGDLTASAGMTTRVEAMADLVLEVDDPVGPVAVGEEAGYEVRIRNRGTKPAEDIQVVTYFSEGIEPTVAEGAANLVERGQVVFSPIGVLGPGEEVLLKVRARAEVAGSHIFRAEVHCRPLDARLVSEDTTLFYLADSAPKQASDVSALEGISSPPDRQPGDDVYGELKVAPMAASQPTPAVPRR